MFSDWERSVVRWGLQAPRRASVVLDAATSAARSDGRFVLHIT